MPKKKQQTYAMLNFVTGILVISLVLLQSCDINDPKSSIQDAPYGVVIHINEDADVTNDTLLNVLITGYNIDSMRVSTTRDFEDTSWGIFDSTMTFNVERQEGVFRLYGLFRSRFGGITDTIVGSIRLDYSARIDSFSAVSASDTLRPGDQIDFMLDAGESGFAEIEFGTLISGYRLLMGEDTIFRRRLQLPSIMPIETVCAIGKFTDIAGNSAEMFVYRHPYFLNGAAITPRIVSRVNFGSCCNEYVVFHDDYCFISDQYNIHVINCEEPDNLTFAYSIPMAGWAHGMCVDDEVLYATDNVGSTGWLRIYDVHMPVETVRIGSEQVPGLARAVVVDEQYAYVASKFQGLHIYDITSAENPALVSNQRTTCTGEAILHLDNYIIIAGDGGMAIIDVEYPEEPRVISEYAEFPDNVTSMSVFDNDLYFAIPDKGIYRLDISDLENPRVADVYLHLEGAMGIETIHPYMFLTREHEISVVNYSDLQLLPVIAEVDGLPASRGVLFRDNMLYAVLNSGLVNLSLTDHDNMLVRSCSK